MMNAMRWVVTSGALLLVVASFSPVEAQSREDVKRLVEGSVPEGRALAFEYLVATNLGGKRLVSIESSGKFQGRSRAEYRMHASQWVPTRNAFFLVGPSGTAFKEDPPPKQGSKGWKMFNPLIEAEREPVYPLYLSPQNFLASIHTYPDSFTQTGTRGIGTAICQGYEGEIPAERVKQLLTQFGLELKMQQKFGGELSGSLVLWIGVDDGLMRSAELTLKAVIEEPKDDPGKPNGGGAAGGGSWDFDSELDPDKSMMTAKMRDPQGDTGDDSMGGAQAKAEELKKRFNVTLSLDQPEPDAKPLEKVQPDPEAARLVSW